MFVEEAEVLQSLLNANGEEEEFGRIYVKRAFAASEDEFIEDLRAAFSAYWNKSKKRLIIAGSIAVSCIVIIIILIIFCKIWSCCLLCNKCISCLKCCNCFTPKKKPIKKINLASVKMKRLDDSTPTKQLRDF